jgi:molecular chaperone GrpE
MSQDANFPETDDLQQLRDETQEARERALRAQAELENVRKRARREIEEERRYANLPLIADLLPAVDNIERAISAAEKTTDAAGLLEGFKMVFQQLNQALAKHHCQRIEGQGEPFDPALHQAIQQVPNPELPNHTIVHVAQAGYRLHDRVVRPAQVIVSSGGPSSHAPAEDAEAPAQ